MGKLLFTSSGSAVSGVVRKSPGFLAKYRKNYGNCRKNKGTKITDNIITRGWADLQNHASLSKSSPLIPGKFYTMKFDLQPDDQIIKKGQQIGLMLFSSDSEYTISPKPGTKLTIDLKETMLYLPVVGGKNAFKKAID